MGYIYLKNKRYFDFMISYDKDGDIHEVSIPLAYETGNMTYKMNDQILTANKDKYTILYKGDGLLFQIKYISSLDMLYFHFSSSEVSKNDENTLIKLQLDLH